MPRLTSQILKRNSPPGFVCVISGAFLFLSVSYPALAQHSPRDGDERRGPPPEAYSACEALSQNDICTVTTPRESLNGICILDRDGQKQVCVPDDRPDRQARRDSARNEAREAEPGPLVFHDRRVTQSSGLETLYPATQSPITDSQYEVEVEGDWRIIKANSISDHMTGEFPNAGNPNTISEQNFNIRVPARPVLTDHATPVKVPAYAFNGVSFDPGAGEFYKGDPSLGWQYEALSGAVDLGIDANHAHVQPTGKYHYHGLPTGLMERLSIQAGLHSAQIGWAVDGFPIYALYGFSNLDGDGEIKKMRSSYRLKSGRRPAGEGQPGGAYDGTFTADYEYVKDLGDLDECNGRVAVTPDFPNGTYAYFLTESFPVVPRCVMGTPDRNMRGPRH